MPTTSFMNSAINPSPVITAPAAAAMTSPAHHAVKFDGNGNFVLAGDGDAAIGVLLGSTDDDVEAGDDLTAQIKDIGYIMAGAAAIAAGAEIAVGAGGVAVTAAAGKAILGYAVGPAAAGALCPIQITKSGYKPAA